MTSQTFLEEKAIDILMNASSGKGIMASARQQDNYGHIWARDVAVSAISILAYELTDLYKPLKTSLLQLQKAASAHGQIPSNIKTNDDGTVDKVSFGGTAGRVDASFWWIVASILYLQETDDLESRAAVEAQCYQIFVLAEIWEFNDKGLMYVPMSSNWADEYITHGYVLYDQLLRYWALHLAGEFFENNDWIIKASKVKAAVKTHFLLETGLQNNIYSKAQQSALKDFDISDRFIASFSPGDRVEKYDAWSIALLLILDIPSAATIAKIDKAVCRVFEQTNNTGVPAFWPVITITDPLYSALQLNHNYHFKNKPGHFHNGGIWPVVNGFLIAGLHVANLKDTAVKLMDAMEEQLKESLTSHPFAEYFDFYDGQPGGVNELCFSASGYLLAAIASKYNDWFNNSLINKQANLKNKLKRAATQIISQLALNENRITVIAISGESGSGKTTISMQMYEALAALGYHTVVLHQDDYFKLPPKKNHEARVNDFNWIGPQEVRLNLMDEHIACIKTREAITINVPKMDAVNDVEITRPLNIAGINVVIVEGTYTAMLQQVDKKIFINTKYTHTRQNRIKRSREAVTDFIERVLEKESAIIQQHESHADIVVDQHLNIFFNHFNK